MCCRLVDCFVTLDKQKQPLGKEDLCHLVAQDTKHLAPLAQVF